MNKKKIAYAIIFFSLVFAAISFLLSERDLISESVYKAPVPYRIKYETEIKYTSCSMPIRKFSQEEMQGITMQKTN